MAMTVREMRHELTRVSMYASSAKHDVRKYPLDREHIEEAQQLIDQAREALRACDEQD